MKGWCGCMAEIRKERRKYKRMNCDFPVYYRFFKCRPQLSVSCRRKPDERFTKALNISPGGLQIIDDIEIKEGAIIRVVLNIGDKKLSSFTKVKWVRFDKNENICKAGLEFLYLKSNDREFLMNLTGNKNRDN